MSPRIPRSFTPDQERAISAAGREVLVVAPAGSGKTEVLIQRVIRALERSAGESFRLLVVTFTVKAAEELKRRTREAIAEELWRVDADTIHGFSLDWLRRYGKEVGIGTDVVVLSDDIDRESVVADYLQSIGLRTDLHDQGTSSMKSLLEAIDTHRVQHNGANCGCNSDYHFHGVALDELADAYDAALRARGTIDFPGMLLCFRTLLKEDIWVLQHFQTLYRDILIDEGQDLTAIQSDLLRRLAGDSVNLFVVADDKQSIRGYAGGAFAHTRALVRRVADAPLHLHHNFRCAKTIIRTAEAVLHPIVSDGRAVMPLEDAPSGIVRFVPLSSAEAEAAYVVSWIRHLLESGLSCDTVAVGEDTLVAPEDIAVFGRTSWTLAPVAEALSQDDIEFVVQMDAGVFLPDPEARLFVDCLAFGVNNNDSPASRRAGDELRELTRLELPADPLVALTSIDNDGLNSLGHLVKRCLRGGDELEASMDQVVDIGNSHGWPEGASALFVVWKDYRTTTAVQDRSPRGFLAHLAKIRRTRPTDPGVQLLTIDRAKGLEFRAVALVGARDGLIPHYRANSEQEQREERRRLYVAMTRASRELMVTWPTVTVDRYGRKHMQSPSPYIEDVLPEARAPRS